MAKGKLNIKLIGMKELTNKLKKYPGIADQVTRKHLFQEAEGIMSAAKDLTPVKTSALKNSGHVQLPKAGRRGIEIELGFGGVAGSGNQGSTNKEDVGYAIRVHEDLNAYHKVGHAKFLELPFNQASEGLKNRLSAALREVMRGLGV